MLSIWHFQAEKNITILEQTSHSPDLTPCDFSPFPKLKAITEGTHFEGVDAAKRSVTTELRGIPEEYFEQCLEGWQRKIGKRIRFEGDHFEGGSLC